MGAAILCFFLKVGFKSTTRIFLVHSPISLVSLLSSVFFFGKSIGIARWRR